MRRREFTSFDVLAVVRELKDAAAGSRVSNIYHLDEHTVLLKLHKADNPDLRFVGIKLSPNNKRSCGKVIAEPRLLALEEFYVTS